MNGAVQFSFDPTGPGASEGLAEHLERVFGAARWVHNRAMIRQWEAIHTGRQPPSLPDLIEQCIDVPSKQEDTSWLLLVPRGVLTDELVDLADDWDDLKYIRAPRELPLKTKKEDQEIVFPAGSFKLITTEDAFGIDFDLTGQIVESPVRIPPNAEPEAVKVERTVRNSYTATVYFG